jgi:hypothetical protein
MPYLSGHGQVYWRFAWASDCANPTTFNTKYGSITGSPKYFIFNGAQNDLYNGNTDTQIEASLQACWQNAHNAGFIVIQASIVPTSIGSPPANYSNFMESINEWLPAQAKTYFNAASGQYFDKFIDLSSYASMFTNLNLIEGNSASGAYYFAERINEAFGTQGGSVNGPPPFLHYNINSNIYDFWNGPGTINSNRWEFLSSDKSQALLYINGGQGYGGNDVSFLSSTVTLSYNPTGSPGTTGAWMDFTGLGTGYAAGIGTGGPNNQTNTWLAVSPCTGCGLTGAQTGDLYTRLQSPGMAWLIAVTNGGAQVPTASFWENHFCVGGSRTCGQPFSANSFGQLAANNTGGTCAMAAATTCTITIATTYTTPVCIATQQTAASPVAASCSVSGTTVTITAATSNSSTWGAFVFGNPN